MKRIKKYYIMNEYPNKIRSHLHVVTIAVNTKTREHESQSSRKLKMAPVRLKDGSHFGSRTFWVNKIVLMSPLTTREV